MITKVQATQLCHRYLALLVVLTVGLGIAHVFQHDTVLQQIFWFNLDAEGNLASWFSGMLFAGFGLSALVVFYWERRLSQQSPGLFRYSAGWLAVALIGFYCSFDEMMVLHENLWWYQLSRYSLKQGGAWQYVNQWQILFIPMILIVFAFFILFFSHRFRVSRIANTFALVGIGCWCIALLIDATTQWLVEMAGIANLWTVLVEESLEFIGAILMIAAVLHYGIEISYSTEAIKKRYCQQRTSVFTEQARYALVALLIVALTSVVIVSTTSQQLHLAHKPTPNIIKRAQLKQVQDQFAQITRRPYLFQNDIWFEHVAGKQQPMQAAELAQLAERIYHQLKHHRDSLQSTTEPRRTTTSAQPTILFLSLFDSVHTAKVFIGSGNDRQAAIQHLLLQATAEAYDFTVLKLDLVTEVEPLTQAAASRFQVGKQGIAFAEQQQIALLPEQVIANHLFTQQDKHAQHWQVLLKQQWAAQAPMSVFNTVSAVYDGQHREYSQDVVIKTALLSAANFYQQLIQANGKLIQAYQPDTDRYSTQYDLFTHLETLNILLPLAKITQDENLLLKTKRSLAFVVAKTKPCPSQQRYQQLCLPVAEEQLLAANTALINALNHYAKLANDRQYEVVVKKLLAAIDSNQQPEGESRQLTSLSQAPVVPVAEYHLQNQFTVNNSLYLKSPVKAIGGFRLHQTDNEIRLATMNYHVAQLLQLLVL